MGTKNRRKKEKAKAILIVLQCIVITAGIFVVTLICVQEIMDHAAMKRTDVSSETSMESEKLTAVSKEQVSETEDVQNTKQTKDTGETETLKQETESNLESESEESEKTQKEKKAEVLAKRYRYPEKILGMLDKNIETLDFVYDYLEKRGHVYASQLDEKFEAGEIPLLIQWDERWGYGSYGENIIATSGCGPTCMAMVIAGLTGNTEITPYTLAAFSEEQGYLTRDGNTSWSLITEGGKEFGVKGQTISLNEETVTETLMEGNPIICSVGPGDFTDKGHFIVLVGCKDGKIQVNDPYSYANSKKLWTFDVLQPQIKNLWKMSIYED